ncbi:MAG: hypothetical protein ABSG01_16290 [Anaerolineales bacterium]|jgi:hypothetical protein
MSDHSKSIVPIQTWCYSSPELRYQGYTIDIGQLAEALIYYDSIFVNVDNPSQFASLIEWFVKQQKYDDLLSLVSEGTLQFYDYSFVTAAVESENIISLCNIQDQAQEKPDSFEQRFLYHPSVLSVLPHGRKPKQFYSAFRGKVIEAKGKDFNIPIENARHDFEIPRRNALILQSYVDELFRFKKLGRPPLIEAVVKLSENGLERKITWNFNFDELSRISGSNLNFNGGTLLTAGGISNRLLWSAAQLNCDLYLSNPMDIVVGDKLYESGIRVLKTNTVIDTLQRSVEFPNIRDLINEAKLNLDDVLLIRRKAGKFRKWLQFEGERDRDALIAYHNEVAKDSGFTKVGRSMLNMFGVLGGAAIGGIIENKVPSIPGSVIGALSVAGTEYLFDLAKRINQDWRPIVFGNWMKDRIEFLLDDLKTKDE